VAADYFLDDEGLGGGGISPEPNMCSTDVGETQVVDRQILAVRVTVANPLATGLDTIRIIPPCLGINGDAIGIVSECIAIVPNCRGFLGGRSSTVPTIVPDARR